MKTLGVFFIGIVCIIIGVLVYVLIKKCPGKFDSMMAKFRAIIEKKLFYSGLIRYVIVSYIKLQNQFFNMFCLALVSGAATYLSAAYGFVIGCLLIYPLWTLYLLIS